MKMTLVYFPPKHQGIWMYYRHVKFQFVYFDFLAKKQNSSFYRNDAALITASYVIENHLLLSASYSLVTMKTSLQIQT